MSLKMTLRIVSSTGEKLGTYPYHSEATAEELNRFVADTMERMALEEEGVSFGDTVTLKLEFPDPKLNRMRLFTIKLPNAVRFCELLDELIDMTQDLPERAEDFADSVAGKLKEIKATVERTDSVTVGQIRSAKNMRSGMERWLN